MLDEKRITDRAIELFEAQSPHQLAVTLAHFEAKHADAMSALDRMTDQRDQLAAQLKDATAQLARAGDLLRDARRELRGDVVAADLFAPSCVYNIEGYLAGEVLPPAAPKGWKLVPIAPTKEMLSDGQWWLKNLSGLEKAYQAMLAVAPEPTK